MNLIKLLNWISAIVLIGGLTFLGLANAPIAMAVAGLAAAVIGTIMYGEERMPMVAAGLVLLMAGGVADFHGLIEHMEWVLFVKLVGLLTWVDYLNHSGYFDALIEKYLPKRFHGFPLLAMLLVLASFSAALIDEVNSIVLWYAVIRAIIGFTKKGMFKLRKDSWLILVILLVSATNIGSQFLPLGNPVGIAISVISELNAVDFIKYTWIPGMVTLAYFLLRTRMQFKPLIKEFTKVSVEAEDFVVLETMHDQYEMVEFDDPIEDEASSEVHSHRPPMKILHALFGVGIAGLILASPITELLGGDPSTGLGMFVLALFAATLYIGSSFGRHTEVLLSELPWNTLFFIVFLFGIAHGLEMTGLTDMAAEQIFHILGTSTILIRIMIVVVGSVVTAFMDNVIAIAVLAPIITALGDKGIETTGLWFTLLAVAVVAGNLTPIGSAANIIANARVKASWITWWKVAGQLALECLVVNVVMLYLWEQVLQIL